MDPKDPLRNPLDPLYQQAEGPRELFRAMSYHANNKPGEWVADAGANLILNALRQVCPNWAQAERAFDDIFGRTKQLLKNHYDSNGRKRGIFPYDQGIEATVVEDGNKFFH